MSLLCGQQSKHKRRMTDMGSGGLMHDQEPGTGWDASALAGLIALLLTVESLEQALHHLAEMAVAVIPDGPSCGITVVRDGRPTTAVYSGSIPEIVHDDQYQRGEGPGLEAASTGQVVVVQDLAEEDRWGGFPAAALQGGARGVYAHPLKMSDNITGALCLYAHEPGLFPEPVQIVARQFAEPARLLLEGVIRRLSQEEVVAQLNEAISSRAVIGQATGIIMAQRRCSSEEAMDALIKISNDRNIKLRDVARVMVEAFAPGKG
jgi:GAF domain-containing protein